MSVNVYVQNVRETAMVPKVLGGLKLLIHDILGQGMKYVDMKKI